MLVCSVSLRPPGRIIGADLAEVLAATDATATGNVVFATLVDDPASVGDLVDAYSGEIMLEAASSADSVDAAVPAIYAANIAEVVVAADTPSATVTGASTTKTIDGTAGGQFTGGGPGTVTLSTTLTNDVIVLVYFHGANSGTTTISNVTSSHLTWTKRSGYLPAPSGALYDCEIWWAPAAAVLTSEVITITLPAAIDDAAYHVFGVNGCANISSPWDTHASLATTRTTGSGTLTVSGISTNSSGPLIIGFGASRNNGSYTAPAGTTKVRADQVNSGGAQFATLGSFYQQNASALSSASYSGGFSAGGVWSIVIDALA